jgi:hypothetical protein
MQSVRGGGRWRESLIFLPEVSNSGDQTGFRDIRSKQMQAITCLEGIWREVRKCGGGGRWRRELTFCLKVKWPTPAINLQ